MTFGGVWAQCSADFDFMGAEFGISPNPLDGEAFADGIVGEPYVDILHVLTPSSTDDIPDLGIDLPPLPVDSLTVNSVSLIGEQGESIALEDIGLSLNPNNNGVSGNPFAFLGGGQYCASLEGVPDSAGFYLASLNVTGYVTIFFSAFGQDFPFEGFTLTVTMPAVPGCTDDMACNFSADATEDDGSCTYADPGYDCAGNCLSDEDNDGVCDPILGCMDAMACNYDATATEDDGMCEYPVDLYDCDGACLMDEDGDGVCDDLEVDGCTDLSACNYDMAATDDDGSCTFAAEYYDCDDNCLMDSDEDGICDELEVAGCTNVYACNYAMDATDDDGSCLTVGDVCDDGNDLTENDTINADCDCVGEEVVDQVLDAPLWAVKVYPNPANHVLFVECTAGGVADLKLTSMDGRQVLVESVTASGRNALNVSELPAGVYVLTVENGTERIRKHVMLGGH